MEMKFNKIIRDYLEESNPNLVKAKTLRAEALEKGSEENEEQPKSKIDWRFVPIQGKSPQDTKPAEQPVKPVKPMTDEEKRIFLDRFQRIKPAEGFDKTQNKDRLIKPADGFDKTQKKDRLIKPV